MEDINLKIFICAHKDFSIYPDNDMYTIIHGDEEINIPLDQITEKKEEKGVAAMNHSYGEGSRIYYLWKHVDLPDYVGICHYSRYFSFFDEEPNFKSIFSECDAIIPKPLKLGKSLLKDYTKCHSKNDLLTISKIITEDYPDYTEMLIESLSDEFLFPCNMFIFPKETFNKYCEFIFGVLNKFNKIRGFETDEDVYHYVNERKEEYLKKVAPNSKVEYQSRLHGFLMERLTNLFIRKNITKAAFFDIVTTEGNKIEEVFKAKNDEELNENENIDIFICAHKDFNLKPSNKSYKIIASQTATFEDTNGLEVVYEKDVPEVTALQRAYGETSRAYYLRHKYDLKKYVGLCHYRRFFSFINDMNAIEKLFETYDAIVLKDKSKRIVYLDFMVGHDLDDLYECVSIAKELYKIDESLIENFLESDLCCNCNMVIFKKEDFCKWVDFLFSIMKEFNKSHGFETDKDVLEYVSSKYDFYKDNADYMRTKIHGYDYYRHINMEYQARLHGFIMERLTALFVMLNFKKEKVYQDKNYILIEEN